MRTGRRAERLAAGGLVVDGAGCVPAERVVVAAGRTPNTDELGSAAAAVPVGADGLVRRRRGPARDGPHRRDRRHRRRPRAGPQARRREAAIAGRGAERPCRRRSSRCWRPARGLHRPRGRARSGSPRPRRRAAGLDVARRDRPARRLRPRGDDGRARRLHPRGRRTRDATAWSACTSSARTRASWSAGGALAIELVAAPADLARRRSTRTRRSARRSEAAVRPTLGEAVAEAARSMSATARAVAHRGRLHAAAAGDRARRAAAQRAPDRDRPRRAARDQPHADPRGVPAARGRGADRAQPPRLARARAHAGRDRRDLRGARRARGLRRRARRRPRQRRRAAPHPAIHPDAESPEPRTARDHLVEINDSFHEAILDAAHNQRLAQMARAEPRVLLQPPHRATCTPTPRRRRRSSSTR